LGSLNNSNNKTSSMTADEVLQREASHVASAVYWGAGVFHYIIDLTPGHFKWIIEGIGFRADRELAMKELRMSVNSRAMSAPFAVIFLVSILAFWEEKPEQSLTIFNWLHSNYPSGIMLKYLGGFLNRYIGNLDISTGMFDWIVKRCQAIMDNPEEKAFASFANQFRLYAFAELGYNLSLEFKWNDAIPYLRSFVDESPSKGYKSFVLLNLGICYEFAGDSPKALESMNRVLPLVRKGYSLDEYSGRRAKKYIISKKMSNFDKIFRQSMTFFETKRFQQGLEFIESSKAAVETEEDESVYRFFTGYCHQRLQHLPQARTLFLEALSYEKKLKTEKWVIPFTHCSLAELEFEDGHTTEALKYIQRASSYSKYDFDTWVSARIKRLQEKIEKSSKSSSS